MKNTTKKSEQFFSSIELRSVCAAYAAKTVSMVVDEQIDFHPSKDHTNAIVSMMRFSQNKAKFRSACLKFVVTAAAFIIIFTTVLATNVHAREVFMSWIRQIFPDHVLYKFTWNDHSEFYQYSIGWVPDGFTLTENVTGENSVYYIYENAEQMVIIEFRKAGSLDYTDFTGYEQAILTDTIINTKEAFIYRDNDSSKVNLTLFDKERGYLIEIDTNIGEESTVKIAENIY